MIQTLLCRSLNSLQMSPLFCSLDGKITSHILHYHFKHTVPQQLGERGGGAQVSTQLPGILGEEVDAATQDATQIQLGLDAGQHTVVRVHRRRGQGLWQIQRGFTPDSQVHHKWVSDNLNLIKDIWDVVWGWWMYSFECRGCCSHCSSRRSAESSSAPNSGSHPPAASSAPPPPPPPPPPRPPSSWQTGPWTILLFQPLNVI